jgi:hypothetical protein
MHARILGSLTQISHTSPNELGPGCVGQSVAGRAMGYDEVCFLPPSGLHVEFGWLFVRRPELAECTLEIIGLGCPCG